MKAINTVTGTASPEQLGTTLMHEHLLPASLQAAPGGSDWPARCRLRKSARAFARHRRVLARARPRPDAGDGQARGELDSHTRVQEHRAGADAGRRRRGENPYNAGRKPAPVFSELAGPALRFSHQAGLRI